MAGSDSHGAYSLAARAARVNIPAITRPVFMATMVTKVVPRCRIYAQHLTVYGDISGLLSICLECSLRHGIHANVFSGLLRRPLSRRTDWELTWPVRWPGSRSIL